jgi:Fe-S cluster biogenesis protein NfuA
MGDELIYRVERVLAEKVRPSLFLHLGDVTVVSVEGGVLRIRMTGSCSGCPTADLTVESLVEEEIQAEIPEIAKVVLIDGVSDSLLAEARKLMALR